MLYYLTVKFTNQAAFDNNVQEAILDGIKYYNEKVSNSSSSTEILAYYYSDYYTLEIAISSKNKLARPHMSLREFTSYLAKNTALNEYLRDSHLFKVTAKNRNIHSAEL